MRMHITQILCLGEQPMFIARNTRRLTRDTHTHSTRSYGDTCAVSSVCMKHSDPSVSFAFCAFTNKTTRAFVLQQIQPDHSTCGDRTRKDLLLIVTRLYANCGPLQVNLHSGAEIDIPSYYMSWFMEPLVSLGLTSFNTVFNSVELLCALPES